MSKTGYQQCPNEQVDAAGSTFTDQPTGAWEDMEAKKARHTVARHHDPVGGQNALMAGREQLCGDVWIRKAPEVRGAPNHDGNGGVGVRAHPTGKVCGDAGGVKNDRTPCGRPPSGKNPDGRCGLHPVSEAEKGQAAADADKRAAEETAAAAGQST